MTVSSILLPLAAATTRYVVGEVGDAVKAGMSFASELRATGTGLLAADESATKSADTVGAPPLTNESQLVRWRAAWQNIQLQTQSLQKVLVEQFAANGIDLSEPIVLSTDTDGRILAAQGHWDRSKIEQMLEANPQLTAQLRELFQQVASLQESTSADEAQPLEDIRLVLDQQQAFFTGSPDAAAWN
ncbi:MAG: hypothetical protein ACYC3X_00695 [Pirellulaceae bacterium]